MMRFLSDLEISVQIAAPYSLKYLIHHINQLTFSQSPEWQQTLAYNPQEFLLANLSLPLLCYSVQGYTMQKEHNQVEEKCFETSPLSIKVTSDVSVYRYTGCINQKTTTPRTDSRKF